jgi:hypothetical protein
MKRFALGFFILLSVGLSAKEVANDEIAYGKRYPSHHNNSPEKGFSKPFIDLAKKMYSCRSLYPCRRC